jgi:hypothetical protein
MIKIEKKIAFTGFTMFMAGIALFLIQLPRFLSFLVPIFTIGGICMLVISTFLSRTKAQGALLTPDMLKQTLKWRFFATYIKYEVRLSSQRPVATPNDPTSCGA